MVAVEPGPRVHIPSPLAEFMDRRSVGVTHHQEVHFGVIAEMPLGPGTLADGSVMECLVAASGFSELATHAIHQPHTQIGWHGSEGGTGQRMTSHAVQHTRRPARFRDPVTVQGLDTPGGDLESERVARKPDVAFTVPEGVAPSIMISPDHDDRHATAEGCQGRGHRESMPRDRTAVGEPEVEEVSRNEETVTQRGNGIEKLE